MASVTSFVNLKGAGLNSGFLNKFRTQSDQAVSNLGLIDNRICHSDNE